MPVHALICVCTSECLPSVLGVWVNIGTLFSVRSSRVYFLLFFSPSIYLGRNENGPVIPPFPYNLAPHPTPGQGTKSVRLYIPGSQEAHASLCIGLRNLGFGGLERSWKSIRNYYGSLCFTVFGGVSSAHNRCSAAPWVQR